MSKIVLGSKPKNFKPIIVRADLPDGSEGVVLMTYKYRTRAEFGAFVDAMLAKARASIAAVDEASVPAKKGSKKAAATEPHVPEVFSYEKLHAGTSKSNAEYVMQIAAGWDLEAELNQANVQQLADEAPGMVQAIMDAYRAACTEGRLGN